MSSSENQRIIVIFKDNSFPGEKQGIIRVGSVLFDPLNDLS
jgi:hypothetical protein